MGVLEPPVENTTCTASVRRQGVTYLVARMVPAALSVMIGWLYVDAFVLKGANLIVKRADLLPTRGFGPPYPFIAGVRPHSGRAVLGERIIVCRAAGFFGEKARQQRHEKRARRDALRALLWLRWHAVCLEDLLLPNLRGGPAVLRENTAIPHLVFPLRLPAGHMYKKASGRP